MHYVFVDESYPKKEGQKTIIMAGWVVDQERYNNFFASGPDLYRTPILENINSMLESLNAWAIVAWADLDENLSRTGEVDGTDDIPSMARNANLWSECFVFTVGMLIANAVYVGQDLETVDIHFDPQSLNAAHAAAIEGTLRTLVVQEAKEYANQFAQISGARSQLLKDLRIRRIEPVAKAQTGKSLDKFQTGTWVADKLCSSYEEIRTRKFSRIIPKDMSAVVRKTVQQYDGKSFYE